MNSAMFTLFPFTQTYTKKKHEVLDFINQMASVNGFVCFCPRGPITSVFPQNSQRTPTDNQHAKERKKK